MLIDVTTISRKNPVSQLALPIWFLTVFHKLIPLSKLGNTSLRKPALIPGNLGEKNFWVSLFYVIVYDLKIFVKRANLVSHDDSPPDQDQGSHQGLPGKS